MKAIFYFNICDSAKIEGTTRKRANVDQFRFARQARTSTSTHFRRRRRRTPAEEDGAPTDQSASRACSTHVCASAAVTDVWANVVCALQELTEFEKNSPDWCTVGAVDDDLMHWNAMLAGPVRTLLLCAYVPYSAT